MATAHLTLPPICPATSPCSCSAVYSFQASSYPFPMPMKLHMIVANTGNTRTRYGPPWMVTAPSLSTITFPHSEGASLLEEIHLQSPSSNTLQPAIGSLSLVPPALVDTARRRHSPGAVTQVPSHYIL